MVGFDKLVEGRSALARGELDDLPGAAVPMHLDDDRLVPEELRMAHRVLKNSGCLPQEVSLRAQIGLLAYEDQQTGRAQTNLSLVMLKLEANGSTRAALNDYRQQIRQRLCDPE